MTTIKYTEIPVVAIQPVIISKCESSQDIRVCLHLLYIFKIGSMMCVCMYPIDAQITQRDLMKFAGIVDHVPRVVFVNFDETHPQGSAPMTPKDSMLFK